LLKKYLICFLKTFYSLLGKLSKLPVNSVSFDGNVIAFTETWLHSSVSDCEIFAGNYVIYRCDRSVRLGVSQSIPMIGTDSILEFVAVRIQVHDYYVFVSCSYIPPRSYTSIYLQHLAQIQSIHSTFGNNNHLIDGRF